MPSQPRRGGLVLVANSDEGFRATLVRIFEQAGYATWETGSGAETLEAARQQPPAFVVLDVGLADVCGYEVCRELREEFGDALPVVFVSAAKTRSDERVAAFLVGADDFLVKPVVSDELLARVRRLLQRAGRSRPPVASGLTGRELEVLRLLADGLSQGQIARRLFISPKTVGTHIERMFKKLGVHSRAQAIAVAYRKNLIEDARDADRTPRGPPVASSSR